MENNLAHPKPNYRPTAPIKRWQRSQIGELWQLDATPHPWFPNSPNLFPMLNMLDDCSRVFTQNELSSGYELHGPPFLSEEMMYQAMTKPIMPN